jgi:hypothetical protein
MSNLTDFGRLLHRICTPAVLILSASSCVATLIFFGGQVRHFADSNDYFMYSVSMADFTVNHGASDRTAGYPAILTATLYPWTKSVLGVLAVQAVTAALIPYFIYRILLYVSERLAIFAALLSIATLLPYLFQMLLFPDQIQVFLLVLFCWVLVKYWFDPGTRNMIWLFVVCTSLAFFRPTFLAYYLYLPLIVGLAIWRDREKRGSYYFKAFLLLAIAVAGLQGSVRLLDSHLHSRAHQERRSTDGRQVFLNAYVDSVGVDGAFEDARYTTILKDRLVDFFRDAPAELTDIRKLAPPIADSFVQYQSDPERMVDALLSDRSVRTFWVLYIISEEYLGATGDPLFMKVALEQYRLHPQVLWNVLKRGFVYYSGLRACEAPPGDFPWLYPCSFFIHAQPDDQYIGYPHFGPYTGMEPYTARVLGPNALSELKVPFIFYATTVFPGLYHTVFLFGAFLTGIGLLLGFYQLATVRGGNLMTQRAVPVLCALTSAYVMYAVPMIVLVQPEFRYVSAGGLLLLMSGLLSLHMVLFDTRASPGSMSARQPR